MTEDPLAIYRIAKKGVSPEAVSPKLAPEEEEESLDQYRIQTPEKPVQQTSSIQDQLKEFYRRDVGQAARASETALGGIGDIQQGFGALLDLVIGGGAEKLTGKKFPELRKVLRDPFSAIEGDRQQVEEFERTFKHPEEASMFMRFPTSQQIKEQVTEPTSEALTGNAKILEPRSETERAEQEFVQTLTGLALPGSGVQSWPARVALAGSGQSAKELAKVMGFEPSTQELAKMGTLGILSIAQIGNAPQFARQFFQDTKAMIPRGMRMNAGPLQQNINRIRQSQWFRGHETPSTLAARQMIEAIEDRIQRGSISVQDAMTLRENINELAHNLGAFNVEGTHRVAHVNRLNEVRDALINGMEQTVGQVNPRWWRQYQDANAAFGITQRSTALGNFIANNYAKPMVSEAGKVLFGNVLAKGAAGLAKIGIAGAGIATGAKAIQIGNRLRDPTLRRYYTGVVRAASRNDAAAMAKSLERFDEYALKEEKADKLRKDLANPRRK